MLNNDNSESRRLMEQCVLKGKVVLNPIIDWEDDDVWEYLNEWVKVPHCSLYDEGFTRLGCIGCPMAGAKGMKRDFKRYPKYKELYIHAFERMIENHPGMIKTAEGIPVENVGGGCSREALRKLANLVFLWKIEELPASELWIGGSTGTQE